ncbi:MAG: YkvA family protein [Candidatus Kryptonium sp.]
MKNYEHIGAEASIYIDQNDKISNIVEKIAHDVREEDIKYVEQNFWQKLASLKGKHSFKKDLLALYRFMKDPAVSFLKKAIAIGALLYFILPLDSIPDLSPIIGFLDDIGIVAMAVKYLSNEIKRYY